MTCAFCKLVSNIITIINARKLKLCICAKQCSNAFSNANILRKKLVNNKSDNCRCVSACNYSSIVYTMNSIDCSGLIKCV